MAKVQNYKLEYHCWQLGVSSASKSRGRWNTSVIILNSALDCSISCCTAPKGQLGFQKWICHLYCNATATHRVKFLFHFTDLHRSICQWHLGAWCSAACRKLPGTVLKGTVLKLCAAGLQAWMCLWVALCGYTYWKILHLWFPKIG